MEQKRGEGKQKFLKGGQAGSRGGCLKGNANSQGILNSIIQISHYYYMKEQ